jgi:SAM-dependent methyltransferase
LTCRCGRAYPVIEGIPRFVDDAFAPFPDFVRRHAARLEGHTSRAGTDQTAPALRRTQRSFGYQWTRFSEMVIDFRENFLDYIRPIDESFFPGKVGLDVGCGFGRHIYNAATFGAEMVGVDISAAIDATRKNVAGLPNVHLVQANLYRLPFRPGTFDFAYSIGVLHHLPDPERGFRSVVAMVKPRGTVFIWVYSKSRRFVNFQLESVRRLTTHLPMRAQTCLTFVAAAIDWGLFIGPYRALAGLPGVGAVVRKMAPPRIKLYSTYPFQVAWADWFDRLAAPIRFYYNGADLAEWLTRARLERTRTSPTGLFGWRAYGEVPAVSARPQESSLK